MCKNVAHIDYSKLDSACVPLVKFFNRHGLATRMSCQGHTPVERSLFYITFDRSITDEDIIRFQSQFLDEIGNFCANGHFAKRLFLSTQQVTADNESSQPCVFWEYCAATIAAADADLVNWQKLESHKGHQASTLSVPEPTDTDGDSASADACSTTALGEYTRSPENTIAWIRKNCGRMTVCSCCPAEDYCYYGEQVFLPCVTQVDTSIGG